MQKAEEMESEDIPEQIVSHPVSAESHCGNNVSKSVKGTDAAIPLDKMLPYELQLVLFSHLNVPHDLVSVQGVSSCWRAAAQDKSLWKNFCLTVSGSHEDERKVRAMPALRNINGSANNELMHTILENVIELVQMNIKFMPPLASSQTQSIIQKYPKLESLTLDMSASDIIESVNILKTSKDLKVLNFIVPDYVTRVDSDHFLFVRMLLSNYLKIYGILADDSNFPALTNIDLSHTYASITENVHSEFSNVVNNVIRQRCQQLSSLKVTLNSSTDIEGFVNAINLCTSLQTLHICLWENRPLTQPINLNIASMTQLTSFYLYFRPSLSFLPKLYDSFCKGSWEHLRELDLRVTNDNHLDILTSIIENMKQLRKLNYYDVCKTTSEMELEKVSSLYELETLNVSGLINISEAGLNFLSRCTNLKYAYLCACSRNIRRIDEFILKVIAPMKKLDHLFLIVNQKIVVIYSKQTANTFHV